MSVARRHTTTSGVTGPGGMRMVPAEGTVTTRPAVPLSVLFLGMVAVVVAVWGAAAPFAGPDFGFVADRASAWTWSVTSACLGLGPGVPAFLAALLVVAAATRASYSRRADVWLLGLVVALCGAWFVVGQYVWPVIYGKAYIAPSTTSHFMWKELCFSIGPGVILVFCGAVFMGWAVRRQFAAVATRSAGAGERTVPSPAARTPRPGATTVTAVPASGAPDATGLGAPPGTVVSSERPVVERPAADRPARDGTWEPPTRA